ncbi:MAG: sugar ABC transporter substrate-binding protein [Planctomycetes bacterium]|nr:sugar ABC transporter substrate-binding protein [Planctomycetota bacterium]
MKKALALALAAALMVAVAAPAGEAKKVVYSIPGLSAPIWTAASEGFLDQAGKFGWQAEILDPNDNLETQISQIENALIRGVEAVVITPIDGDAVSTLTAQCAREGVPVIAIDRQVTGESLATVEADNLLVGRQLGEMYLKTLGNKSGKVLIVGGPLSSSATVNRTEGFKAAIQGKANVEIVAESATEMDSEVVLAAVTNYLQANPDINCIMSCTDYILPAVMTALSENGKLHKIGEAGHVNVYSVDGDGYGLGQVVDGYIDATYGLDPFAWAASAVEALKTYFDGGKVNANILIAGNIVTKDNFQQLKDKGALWGAGSME